MKRMNKLAITVAAFSLAAASFGTSAFADSRSRDETSWHSGNIVDRDGDFDRRGRVYIRGRIERIDYRRDVMFVRDEFSRRTIEIDVHRFDRESRRFDLDRMRRGDRVRVWGDWRGHGVLEAGRVE